MRLVWLADRVVVDQLALAVEEPAIREHLLVQPLTEMLVGLLVAVVALERLGVLLVEVKEAQEYSFSSFRDTVQIQIM
jgi:hypothetical protein